MHEYNDEWEEKGDSCGVGVNDYIVIYNVREKWSTMTYLVDLFTMVSWFSHKSGLPASIKTE